MKQYEAVIKIMEENGGYATLGYLYQNVPKIKDVEWKTKTPFASIRRIVQDERFFFKIKPGLWAINHYRSNLPPEIFPAKEISVTQKQSYDRSYYQGLLIEIGNLKNLETIAPAQDKNHLYLNRKLGDIITAKEFYKFSYDKYIRRAKTVDVVWFNERKMPHSFFEVEHSTDMQNSLLKFVDLQDFYSSYFIVSNNMRKGEFERKLQYSSFASISNRVKFLCYEDVSEWHTKSCEYYAIENKINF